ncbi:hypothetical protein GGTG_07392 [Gaeumannomyces tritici R3-111a-1]|uniref:Uncharacterized protein n=1 Tax=Gaeumannomyces tritici (strain R3-111a-1) TaxID=644352 RepID=J3P1J4_GAET3|nr:hypothetical protein GGTG_07392 [Gaeumannomyces tritici R3-111a-1]EJT73536.1 hypothetical protein GGTG_07392 [Gaeumannomyces tritici R3-111a-1]
MFGAFYIPCNKAKHLFYFLYCPVFDALLAKGSSFNVLAIQKLPKDLKGNAKSPLWAEKKLIQYIYDLTPQRPYGNPPGSP